MEDFTPLQYTPTTFESLFRRCLEGCVGVPACPTCPTGQSCSQVPPTCYACQKTICVANSALPTTISNAGSTKSSGPNVGAISGGVVGGVIVIIIITALVWRCGIKPRRQQYEQEDWAEEAEDTLGPEKAFTMRRDARASTHTVGSIASTVLTRASNIIQIAYIPGVTNRSAPSTPGLLVPPVPPIPIALSSNDGNSPRYEPEHFFMPSDLRDTMYSDVTDRTSYARTSVASTVYGKNAIVSPVPAQTVIRGNAKVVSVKSSGGGSGELTPPVPIVDYDKYGPPSPAFSVGSTFLNSASAATPIRPNVVRVVSGPKKTPPPSTPEEDNHARDSNAITIIDDTPALDQGPFRDPPNPAPRSPLRYTSHPSLSAVTELAQARAQNAPGERATTPFGDENEIEER